MQLLLNNLIPDHEADAFHQESLKNPGVGDQLVEFALGGFSKWDAAYFMHIAENGYTRGHMFAFFPLYPLTIRLLTDTALYPLQAVMHLRSVLLIAGWLTNILAFTVGAVVLYELTRRVCKSDRLAYVVAILYCIHPASVFMSALYTEAMYSMLSLWGMLLLEQRRYLSSAILFGLASATRSNGIVTLGFVVYHSAQIITHNAQRFHWLTNLPNLKLLSRQLVCCATRVIYTSAIVSFPLLFFQMYAFHVVCRQETDITFENIFQYWIGYIVPRADDSEQLVRVLHPQIDNGAIPQWCHKSLVIPYSQVQAEHWNVGFLHYYELKQLPNFILASPIVILSLCGMWDYCRVNWEHVSVLGLFQPIGGDAKKVDDRDSQSQGFYHPRAFVYLAHMNVLLVFGVLCMHVQVVTRFLVSSSPAVLWIAAHIMLSSLGQNGERTPPKDSGSVPDLQPIDIIWRKNLGWKGRLVRGYFLGYCVIGVALHCNFLPWT